MVPNKVVMYQELYLKNTHRKEEPWQRGNSGAPSGSFAFRALALPEVYSVHRLYYLFLTNQRSYMENKWL